MTVSLVIPGRNTARTIRPCLESVVPLLESGALEEIIFVDDGSTDATRAIVAEYPVRLIEGEARGPGAARNLGWRAATGELVWFMDSDCVAEPNALQSLLPHMDDPVVGGVSGSYGNMLPNSLLACLIHEEIIERHLKMPSRVDFCATFNVIYRRSILEEIDGFDERFLKGQDAELSWRVLNTGKQLGFEYNSRVRHFHADRLFRYLRTQRQQGYWRVWLHLSHAGHAAGDSYSSALDHLQPPLAMLALGASPLLLTLSVWPYAALAPIGLAALLLLAQTPLTGRLVVRTRQIRYATFAGMSFLRAFWRGVGMTKGVVDYVLKGNKNT